MSTVKGDLLKTACADVCVHVCMCACVCVYLERNAQRWECISACVCTCDCLSLYLEGRLAEGCRLGRLVGSLGILEHEELKLF